MEVTDLLHMSVDDESAVGEARRCAADMGRRQGFDESSMGTMALLLTEMGTNVVKHAREGQLVVQFFRDDDAKGVELLALDRGQGIAHIGECMSDGFSTAGSPGTGLGALRRLSTLFYIYSLPGSGTAVFCRFVPQQGRSPGKASLDVGGFSLPRKGEEVSGDAWACEHMGEKAMILLADGLGHGIDAFLAAQEAVRIFKKNRTSSPKAIIEAIHAALRSTRGAAVAVAEIDTREKKIHFAGAGNIRGIMIKEEITRNLVSLNGTAGVEIRKIQEFTYPWQDRDLLIFHSDGLSTQWHMNASPGLSEKHPSLIAGVLLRDFSRGTDDVTVVAVRGKRGQGIHSREGEIV